MSSDVIRIDTDKLDDIGQQLNQLGGSLSAVSTSIVGISATALLVIPEQPNIIRSINTLKTRVSATSMYAKRLSRAVTGASAQWAAAENAISSKPMDEGEDPFKDSAGGGGGSKSGKTAGDYLLSLLQKMIGGIGPVGKIVSAIWAGIEKGTLPGWLKSGADIAGEIAKLIGKVAKESPSTSAKWLEILFNTSPFTKTAGEIFKEKIGLSSNPIGWIVNGVKSIIDNWDYAKSGNIPRFITESLAETATNVALGAAGVAAAAAVVALLPVEVPAVVVTIAGAAIVWGANEISKLIFDKTIAEGVGEIVGDATDWLRENVPKGIEWAKEKGSEAVEWVEEKADQAIEWAKEKGKQAIEKGKETWEDVKDYVKENAKNWQAKISDAKDTVCGWFGFAM